jgi:hypothetical protein
MIRARAAAASNSRSAMPRRRSSPLESRRRLSATLIAIGAVCVAVAFLGPPLLKFLHDNYDLDVFNAFMTIALLQRSIMLMGLGFASAGLAIRPWRSH